MVKRVFGWLVVLPFTALVIALAVANRAPVTFAWNPIEAGNPGHGITLPLFALLFVAFGLGILVGGVVVWTTQGRWRRTAVESRAEIRRLSAEIDRLKAASTSVVPD